jgi:hypothetical protein
MYYVIAYNALGGDSDKSNIAKVLPITVPSGLSVPTLVTNTETSITV